MRTFTKATRKRKSFALLICQFGMAASVLTFWGCELLGSGTIKNDDSYTWPEPSISLLPCQESAADFSLPDTTGTGTRLKLIPSSLNQPFGQVDSIVVLVTTADGELDKTANGQFTISAGGMAELITKREVKNGEGSFLLKFTQEGLLSVQGSFHGTDSLQTSQPIKVYRPQLPIWQLEIDPVYLTEMFQDVWGRFKRTAKLVVDGVEYKTEVRLHGGTSRDFRKKSFRFDLMGGRRLPDGTDHLILRAEFADKSLLRNHLAMEMFNQGTWIPAPKTEMVHFRLNHRYYGVMWHVERIDKEFLRSRDYNPNGSMYEADPPLEISTPGGNLTPVSDPSLYPRIYDHKAGYINYTDLIDLIEGTLTSKDASFESEISSKVKVNNVLVYLALLAVIQNQDHIKKNYYLYRDPEALDERWMFFPWDLDLSMGHLWSEQFDVLDERIITDASIYVGEKTEFGSFYNPLFYRLWDVPEYKETYLRFINTLLERVFTIEFINSRIENVLCRGAPDIAGDNHKRASNAEYLARVEELRTFVKDRKAYLIGTFLGSI